MWSSVYFISEVWRKICYRKRMICKLLLWGTYYYYQSWFFRKKNPYIFVKSNIGTFFILSLHKRITYIFVKSSIGTFFILSVYKCAVLWRAVYVPSATEGPLGTICEETWISSQFQVFSSLFAGPKLLKATKKQNVHSFLPSKSLGDPFYCISG